MVQSCVLPQTLLWERPWPRIRPSMEFRMLAPQRTVCSPLTVPITLNRTKFHWTTELGSKQTPDHRVLLNRYPECLRRQENICPRVQGNICPRLQRKHLWHYSECLRTERQETTKTSSEHLCECVSPAWEGLQRDPPGGTRGVVVEAEGTLRQTSGTDQGAGGSREQTQAGVKQLAQHLEKRDVIWLTTSGTAHMCQKNTVVVSTFHFDKKHLWWKSVREGVEPEVTWLLNAQQPRVLLLWTKARAPSRTWNQSLKILVKLLHLDFIFYFNFVEVQSQRGT